MHTDCAGVTDLYCLGMKILVLLLLTIVPRTHHQYGIWCGILSDHDHATNQILFCKSAFSCCLNHSS